MEKSKSKKGYVTLSNGQVIRPHHKSTWQYVVQHKWLYFLILPGIIYFIMFRYIPMGGLIIAFKEYSPFRLSGVISRCSLSITRFNTG